jgi:hypothetical protein
MRLNLGVRPLRFSSFRDDDCLAILRLPAYPLTPRCGDRATSMPARVSVFGSTTTCRASIPDRPFTFCEVAVAFGVVRLSLALA